LKFSRQYGKIAKTPYSMKKLCLAAMAVFGACVLQAQNADSTLTHNWSSTQNTWINNLKTIFVKYDNQDSITHYYTQIWNSRDTAYRNSQQNFYYRNSNGDLDSSLQESWDQNNNKWKGWQFSSYTYNSQNQVTEQLDKTYLGSSWRNSTKLMYTYDSQNFLTESLRQIWDGTNSNWRNSQRNQYQNNSSGWADTAFSAYWNMSNSQWVTNRKNWYTHNSQGFVLTDQSAIYLTSSSTWRNSTRNTYTYNTNNDMLTSLREFWNSGTNSFRNSQKTQFTYDSNGKLVKQETDNWNTQDSSWRHYNTIDYTYNTNGKMDVELTKTWSIQDTNWRNNKRVTYYYSGSTVSDNEIGEKKAYTVYPNPATQFIHLGLNADVYPLSVNIQSMDGRISKTVQMTSNTLDITGLPRGIYILQMELEGEPMSFPIVKQD
jgi:hypothetical protein